MARVKAAERDVLFAWGEKNGMLPQTLGPMIEASDGSGIPTARIIDVSRAVALEIGECDLLLIPSCRLTNVIVLRTGRRARRRDVR